MRVSAPQSDRAADAYGSRGRCSGSLVSTTVVLSFFQLPKCRTARQHRQHGQMNHQLQSGNNKICLADTVAPAALFPAPARLLACARQEVARLEGQVEEQKGSIAALKSSCRAAENAGAELQQALSAAQKAQAAAQREASSKAEELQAVKAELQQVGERVFVVLVGGVGVECVYGEFGRCARQQAGRRTRMESF